MRTARFNDVDARIAQNTRAFALERLSDRSFLEWALTLRQDQIAERTALRDLVEYRGKEIAEPYLQAWQYLFEFWDGPSGDASQDRLLLKHELKTGGSPTEIISLIVAAVRPWIRVENGKKYEVFGHKRAKEPKSIGDVFWVSMEGGKGITPEEIGLSQTEDRDFLFELAVALNAALLHGLNQAHRIGYIGGGADPTSWLVQRVYYVPPEQYPDGGGEPDRHKQGFAPTTKLLFAVVERLAQIDKKAALRIIASWDVDRWKLYKRLWAAAARDATLIEPSDVGEFLTILDDQEFWWTHAFPEIAELRAVRWSSLSLGFTKQLEQRILKGEPPARLRKRLGREEAKAAVTRLSMTELQRIKLAGGHLSGKAESWLQQAFSWISQAPMTSATQDFPAGVRTIIDDRSGDPTFDDVPSSRLIEELARQLSDDGWDSKTQAASDYIGRNPDLILDLLAGKPHTPARAKVWQAFGYSFRPKDINALRETATAEDKALVPAALRACVVIARTDVRTLEEAASGLATWISTWDRLLNGEDDYIRAWLALWPHAVTQTNKASKSDSRLRERTFSTPVGQLANGLMRSIPAFKPGALTRAPWSDVLVSLEQATGEAKLQVRFQLMLFFEYLWVVDRAWTRKNLLTPLGEASGESMDLWQAFAETRHMPARDVFVELGPKLIEVAAGNEMPAEVRGSLARRVIYSTINDKRDGREPAIPSHLTQQMLRIGGEEVRSSALRAMKNHLKDLGGNPQSAPAERFALIKELFESVWPKELTLSSPALSDALADFPAAAGPNFAEAANLVLPYLMPFECWSLYEYGVLDRTDKQISRVDSPEDAAAFLSILDKTVGAEEGAIIPNGLDRALRHIVEKSPRLEKDTRYQRLLTLSRR
ncbi:hypothetical protein CN071_19020 [Sinorhizobium meliloti]|uniref:hypothetical protein n=1 Tax=Rhizobium meliloti TaxID=382 RepID=UPI000FD749E2|nr:hypothetical protein [Sinorhizobium meliloti]RVP63947.1 hypothetical protein CN071_19020 [Sinorhizobium meliloti]